MLTHFKKEADLKANPKEPDYYKKEILTFLIWALEKRYGDLKNCSITVKTKKKEDDPWKTWPPQAFIKNPGEKLSEGVE